MVLEFINKLNMKALKFFLSFLLLIVFVSCDKKCYRNLTDDEKNRLGFKINENIVFKSNLNQFDTLEINSEIDVFAFSKTEKCKNQQHTFNLGGLFKRKLYSQLYAVSVATKIYEPEYKSKDFVYPEISSHFGYFTINKNTPLTSININGNQLYNVYELNNNSHITTFDVDKIYFSFEYGLLKIVLHDGSYWERINY